MTKTPGCCTPGVLSKLSLNYSMNEEKAQCNEAPADRTLLNRRSIK